MGVVKFKCASSLVCFEGSECAEKIMFRHAIRKIEWVEIDDTYYFLFEFLYDPANAAIENCVCFYINKRKPLRFDLEYVDAIPSTSMDYSYTARYVLGDCAVCLQSMSCTQDLALFELCNHVLHHLCMESFMSCTSENASVVCPTCRMPVYDWDYTIAWKKYFKRQTLCICNKCVHLDRRW